MGFLFPSVLNSLWWRRHRTKLASPPCGERVVVCLFIWCSLFVVLLRVVVVACYVDHAVLALPSGRGWDELKESLKTSWIFLEMNNNNSWQKWKWLKDKIMLGRWEWSQWQCEIRKTEKKWENGPKRPILGIFWCFWVTKSVSPQLRPGCKVVFFIIFADYDGWEPEKSRNNAQWNILCQKCSFLTKPQSLLGQNVP